MNIKSLVIYLLTCLLFLTACTDQEVWKGDQRSGSNKGTQKNKADPMLTYKAATSLEGMLSEGPGKYANVTQTKTTSGVLLATEAVGKIKKFPKNLTAKQAYDRLIYLLAKDYTPYITQLKQFDPKIPLSSKRKETVPFSYGPAKKLNVNVVILIDAGPSLLKKANSEETVFSLMKENIKETFQNIESKSKNSVGPQLNNVSYQYAIRTYTGKVKRFTPLVKEDKIKQEIIPAIEEIQPGGAGSLADALEQTKQDLLQYNNVNDLNQVYVISHGKDGLDENAVSKAKDLLYSEAQAQVHTIGYQLKDAQSQELLKRASFQGLGEYQETNGYLDFHDKTNNTGNDYGLREYKDLLEFNWKKVMTERKKNQVENLVTVYRDEQMLLENATVLVDISSSEKDLLSRKINDRINRIKGYIDGKFSTLVIE